MPLSGTGGSWGDTIGDTIIAANDPGGLLSAAEKETIKAGWRAIKGEDVSHITTNTLVTTSVPGAPLTGNLALPIIGVAIGIGSTS